MKPVRSFLLLFGLALGGTSMLVGEPVAAGTRPDLYGTWDLFEVRGSGMAARVRLTVEDGVVTNTSWCSFGENSVHVRASSPAVITDEEIAILHDSMAEKAYEPGSLNCQASLDKGTIRYELVDGHLVLRPEGQDELIELTRSGAAFVQARRLAGMPR